VMERGLEEEKGGDGGGVVLRARSHSDDRSQITSHAHATAIGRLRTIPVMFSRPAPRSRSALQPSAQYSSAPCVLSRDARQLRVREQFAAGDVRSLCAYNHASSVLIHAALHRQLIQAQTTQ